MVLVPAAGELPDANIPMAVQKHEMQAQFFRNVFRFINDILNQSVLPVSKKYLPVVRSILGRIGAVRGRVFVGHLLCGKCFADYCNRRVQGQDGPPAADLDAGFHGFQHLLKCGTAARRPRDMPLQTWSALDSDTNANGGEFHGFLWLGQNTVKSLQFQREQTRMGCLPVVLDLFEAVHPSDANQFAAD
jgi:hypothetical protein